jgi:hypothetical protein
MYILLRGKYVLNFFSFFIPGHLPSPSEKCPVLWQGQYVHTFIATVLYFELRCFITMAVFITEGQAVSPEKETDSFCTKTVTQLFTGPDSHPNTATLDKPCCNYMKNIMLTRKPDNVPIPKNLFSGPRRAPSMPWRNHSEFSTTVVESVTLCKWALSPPIVSSFNVTYTGTVKYLSCEL